MRTETSLDIGQGRVQLLEGDITAQKVEVIVNAANRRLAGGGGVDGAIHRAAGPLLMQQLKKRYPQGCPTGSAVITDAGALAARYVIHAVGPRYVGKPQDAEALAGAYMRSLELCTGVRCQSIAFPSIATGVYGYPLEAAAPLALRIVAEYLQRHALPADVRFVLFDEKTFAAYASAMQSLKGG